MHCRCQSSGPSPRILLIGPNGFARTPPQIVFACSLTVVMQRNFPGKCPKSRFCPCTKNPPRFDEAGSFVLLGNLPSADFPFTSCTRYRMRNLARRDRQTGRQVEPGFPLCLSSKPYFCRPSQMRCPRPRLRNTRIGTSRSG